MNNQIKKKYLESKTFRDKYLARLKVLDRYIFDFESDIERLTGPSSEKWEDLINTCQSFKKQYEPLDSIYNRPNSEFYKISRDIIAGKKYPKEYIERINKLMDDTNELYKKVEDELNERIEVVREMRNLLIQLEEEQ